MQANYIRIVCYKISFCTVGRSLCMIWYMIYLLTAIGLTPGGSNTVQYTFTHSYTEQHSETEYTEQNVHKNNKT